MKVTFFAVVCAAFAVALTSSPSLAQQKTVKQCQTEWRANKEENQAKGLKESDYVAQCRASAVAPTPAAAPAQKPAATPPVSAGNGKTAKECRAEYKAGKADYDAKGITEKQFVAQCRTGGVVATPIPNPAPAPTPVQPPRPTSAPRTTPPTVSTSPAGVGQYRTDAEVKGRCPSDTVVWVNIKSKIYHFAGTKNYGTTKSGAYMCERDAMGQGNRASKTERHP